MSGGYDPFEHIGTDPRIAINAAKLVTTEDPERAPQRSQRSAKRKASKALGNSLTHKAIAAYQALEYMAFRVDSPVVGYGGAIHTEDLLGIADIMAVGHGRVILVQCTVSDQRTAHERKFCEDTKPLRRTQKTAYQNLMEWFEHGGELEMILFQKDAKGHWQPSVIGYTKEWVMERKVKLDTRRAA